MQKLRLKFNGFELKLLSVMRVLEFLNRQIHITSIFGVPILIENWFVIVAFLLSLISAKSIPMSYSGDFLAAFALGLATVLLLIVSLIFHEFAHLRTAFKYGLEALDSVIYPFGGIARFRRITDNQEIEFRVSIAGPIASFILAIIFLTLTFVASAVDLDFLSPSLFQLFSINLLLAILNLFPAFPLDGGKVLRLYLRKRGYESNQANVLAAKYGKIIVVILILFGLFLIFGRNDLFNGSWLIVVGVFIFSVARKIIAEVKEFELLLVKDVMTVPVFVEPNTIITRFMEKTLPLFRQNVFLVARDKQFYGVLIVEDIKKLPRDDWHQTKVHTVMRPIVPEYFVETTTFVNEAREIMRGNGIGALGVIDESGNLIGFIQRGKIRKRN